MAVKSGRTLGDIFTSTAPKAAPAPAKGAKPAVSQGGSGEVFKVTTFFTQDQLDYLDDQSKEIKRNTRATLKRTTILRALVQGFMLENVNLGACATEAALAEAVRKRMPLKGGRI